MVERILSWGSSRPRSTISVAQKTKAVPWGPTHQLRSGLGVDISQHVKKGNSFQLAFHQPKAGPQF